MNDTIWAAIIAVSGALIASLIAAIVQIKITKKVSDNSKETAMAQVVTASRLELERKRRENIVGLISDLVATIHPERNKTLDPQKVARMLYRIQLQLNRNNEMEKVINGHLNKIGFIADGTEPTFESTGSALLREQGKLTDAVWEWFNS